MEGIHAGWQISPATNCETIVNQLQGVVDVLVIVFIILAQINLLQDNVETPEESHQLGCINSLCLSYQLLKFIETVSAFYQDIILR